MVSSPPQTDGHMDTLQTSFNDVLIQIGKSLRASAREDGPDDDAASAPVNPRLPAIVSTFHAALDELERDILNAQSVLVRDLSLLRSTGDTSAQFQIPTPVEPKTEPQQPSHSQPQSQPEPVQSQTKSPMVIDLGSSPSAVKTEPAPAETSQRPMAPFPDMGSDLAATSQQPEAITKEENTSVPPTQNGIASNANAKPESDVAAPMGDAGPSLGPDMSNVNGNGQDMNGAPDLSGAELNFTNMEFSLAPPSNDTQGQTGNMQDLSIDLANFAPAQGGDDLLSLAPPNGNGQTINNNANIPNAEGGATVNGQVQQQQPAGSNFDNVFGFDDGDGMDFDFSLDGGGGDTFNDLMQDRDGTFDMTGPDDLDTTFFFDKPDET